MKHNHNEIEFYNLCKPLGYLDLDSHETKPLTMRHIRLQTLQCNDITKKMKKENHQINFHLFSVVE